MLPNSSYFGPIVEIYSTSTVQYCTLHTVERQSYDLIILAIWLSRGKFSPIVAQPIIDARARDISRKNSPRAHKMPRGTPHGTIHISRRALATTNTEESLFRVTNAIEKKVSFRDGGALFHAYSTVPYCLVFIHSSANDSRLNEDKTLQQASSFSFHLQSPPKRFTPRRTAHTHTYTRAHQTSRHSYKLSRASSTVPSQPSRPGFCGKSTPGRPIAPQALAEVPPMQA